MGKKLIIGVMGPGDNAGNEDKRLAFEVGRLIARMGYVLLTGGRNAGVMDAALKGARKENGLTIGILPGDDVSAMSPYVDIPIITGMGNARNVINILSCKAVVAIGEGAGTFSEIAFAIKLNKPVIALNISPETIKVFNQLGKNHIHAFNSFNENLFTQMLKSICDAS